MTPVLVLFPDEWVAYSPTVLNLARTLGAHTRVLALHTGRADNEALDSATYRLLRIPPLLVPWLKRTLLFRPLRILMLAFAARREPPGITLAVDLDGACAAVLAGRSFHFVSLEVHRNPLMRWLLRHRGRSVLIQSEARLDYLLPAARRPPLPVFLVQNSPPLRREPPVRAVPDPARALRLLYLGHALPRHGIFDVAALLGRLPRARLTVHGLIPPAVARRLHADHAADLAAGRLELSTRYLDDAQLDDFIGTFDIGLCLYDVEGLRRDFNYMSSPSGKMFGYFRAGLPTIGSDVPGLDPIRQFRAGILVPQATPDALSAAVDAAVADYAAFSAGARRAAIHFDFDRSVAPYARFVLGDAGAGR